MVTESELNEIVAAPSVRIRLYPEATERTFDTFKELKEYFQTESRFWNPTGVSALAIEFDQIASSLNQAERENDINAARRAIINATARASNRALVYSSTAEGKFLATVPQLSGDARAAHAYLTDLPTHDYVRTSQGMTAILAAVIFRHPDIISDRVQAEISAAAEQRAAATKLRDEAAATFDGQAKATDQWQIAAQKRLDELVQANERVFAGAHKDQTERSNVQFDEIKKERAEWTSQRKADEGTFTSNKAVGGSAVVSSLLCSFLRERERYCTRRRLSSHSDAFTLTGFKGAILVAGAISGFLYLVNLFVKVATSSFHLARDARERFQLTHVYLALIKDGAIEAKDREIILSALFSRSDTGLLKGDSSPTLPTPLGSILENLKVK